MLWSTREGDKRCGWAVFDAHTGRELVRVRWAWLARLLTSQLRGTDYDVAGWYVG